MCMCVGVFIYIHTYLNVYIYIYTCIYIHIYARTAAHPVVEPVGAQPPWRAQSHARQLDAAHAAPPDRRVWDQWHHLDGEGRGF